MATPKKITSSDGSPRWVVTVDAGTHPDGRRRQLRRTFTTERAARAFDAMHRSSLLDGSYVGKRNVTVREVVDDWLASRTKPRPNTVAGYRSGLQPVLAEVGDLHVQRLTPARVVALRDHLASTGGKGGAGRTARTVNLQLGLLYAALEQARKARLIPYNPVSTDHVERLPEGDHGIGQAWTVEQVARFTEQITGDRYEAAWRLSLLGLRRSEVLGLQWQHVDLDNAVVSIVQARTPRSSPTIGTEATITGKPKSKRGTRIVPVDAATVTALRTFRALQVEERFAVGHRLPDDGYVVVDQTFFPISPDYYSDRFQMLAAEAGLPRIRLHDLRHTASTRMQERGVPVATAAALLGHDAAVMLRTYTHIGLDALRDAQQRLTGTDK